MRDRMRLLERVDFASAMSSIDVPTAVITGEAELDRVVPPDHTRGYLRLLPHAECVTFERTGHIGVVTRPAQFAETVASFVGRADRAARHRRESAQRVAGSA